MILESREVTKKYGSKTAVNQVSLQLEPGLVYAMLGPNGSGKTTWMKMVAGLVKPTNGEILYQGTPIGKESKKEIAYMSTEPYFYNWMTVSDVGKYYEDFFEDFSMEKYRQMISRMELTQEATELVQIESQLAGNVRLTIITMCAAILVATAILLRRSFRLTYSITKPISEILHNIKKVGKGEYKTINVVSADSVEIQELDAGTRKMAGRIEGLLENVRKEQEVQHMTELQLIQAQVNPHFLYNTLDTIVWLVEGGMQQDAVDMITSLSVFFRTSLSKGKDIIPLSEEKRHTLSYLEIQQSRYRDIMEFEINIPPELDEVMVPKLTLQPLAENALYHGIKNKRGKGKILIEGFNLGDDMMLRVTDNGQGMTPERLYEVQEAIRTGERAGFGLAAVSERIALYYGPGYGLKISSTEGEGTVMEVYMAKKINLDNNSR